MPDLFAPYRQFDSRNSTRSSDCGPNAALWALRWQTNEQILPDGRDAIDKALRQIRALSEPESVTGAITLRELKKGYDGYGRAHAHPDPKLDLRRGADVEDVLWPALTSGKAAFMGVNYGIVNRRRPDLSGSLGFDKGHAIIAINGRVVDGRRFLTVADPTRKHLTTWPWWLLKRATGLYGTRPWGIGKGEFGTIRRLGTVDDHETPPPHRTDAEERIRALKAKIDSLEDEITELEAELATRAGKTEQLREIIRRLREVLAQAEAGDESSDIDEVIEQRLPDDPTSSRFGRPDDEAGDGDVSEGAVQDQDELDRTAGEAL